MRWFYRGIACLAGAPGLDRQLSLEDDSDAVGNVTPLRHGGSASDPEDVVELHPELHVHLTLDGVNDAKLRCNQYISSDYQEAFRWYSKAIWLAESGLVKDVPRIVSSQLYSNRAFACLKMHQWSHRR